MGSVGKLSSLAVRVGLEGIPKRPSADEVAKLYEEVCRKVSADMVDELLEARSQYVDNGGGERGGKDPLSKTATFADAIQHSIR